MARPPIERLRGRRAARDVVQAGGGAGARARSSRASVSTSSRRCASSTARGSVTNRRPSRWASRDRRSVACSRSVARRSSPPSPRARRSSSMAASIASVPSVGAVASATRSSKRGVPLRRDAPLSRLRLGRRRALSRVRRRLRQGRPVAARTRTRAAAARRLPVCGSVRAVPVRAGAVRGAGPAAVARSGGAGRRSATAAGRRRPSQRRLTLSEPRPRPRPAIRHDNERQARLPVEVRRADSHDDRRSMTA